MTKQEQIKEMIKLIGNVKPFYVETIVEALYNAGYRKEQETAKEIERLKAENEELTKVVSSKVYDLIDNAKEIADARETWEKQAKIEVLNRLKSLSIYDDNYLDGYVFIDDIEKLLEELKK